ncbi:MAG: hypothetical protein AAF215_13450 [Cyanobacteria bacterium P01_A01_bin.123]
MKSKIKFLVFFVTTIFISFSSSLYSLSTQAQGVNQTGGSTSQVPLISNELLNGIILAVVSAIFGFLASFLIERINKRSEPRAQISYSKIIKSGIIGILEKDIEDKISVLYAGKPAKNMFYALFDIENTGNQQVKNQEIRFEFTDNSEILDVFFEPPKIEPEMEFKELLESGLGKHEKKYRIGIIKPSEKLGFRFIVQDSGSNSIKFLHHTKNESDVTFTERELKRVADDIEQVKIFLTLCIVFFVLIPLFENTISPFFPLASSFFSLIMLSGFVFLIFPRFEAFIRTTVNLISELRQETGIAGRMADKVGVVVMGGSANIEAMNITHPSEETENG